MVRLLHTVGTSTVRRRRAKPKGVGRKINAKGDIGTDNIKGDNHDTTRDWDDN